MQFNTTASAALQTYLNDYAVNWWHSTTDPRDGAPLGWHKAPLLYGASDKTGMAGVEEAVEQLLDAEQLTYQSTTQIAIAVAHPAHPGRNPTDNYWSPATQVMVIP
jgi:hypothetical protein